MGFVISDHTDSSQPKTGRSEKGSFTMTSACPGVPVGKRKQQTDLHGEDKKKKQHELLMNNCTKCIYFGLKHKRFSNRIHSLG